MEAIRNHRRHRHKVRHNKVHKSLVYRVCFYSFYWTTSRRRRNSSPSIHGSKHPRYHHWENHGLDQANNCTNPCHSFPFYYPRNYCRPFCHHRSWSPSCPFSSRCRPFCHHHSSWSPSCPFSCRSSSWSCSSSSIRHLVVRHMEEEGRVRQDILRTIHPVVGNIQEEVRSNQEEVHSSQEVVACTEEPNRPNNPDNTHPRCNNKDPPVDNHLVFGSSSDGANNPSPFRSEPCPLYPWWNVWIPCRTCPSCCFHYHHHYDDR
mmetsp:Transcript_20902/g.39690  ORF Transcript_20902/g.39690 Transcript_20902/m.39690 type:complete len:261 (-) Transcript_20902:278-1060(-)